MKKSFTLIELIITVSLIAVMAVIAVPAFNNYSVRADTQAKAEEIKYLIEKAYISAQNPVNGNNAAMIGISFPVNNAKGYPFARYEGKLDSVCFDDINAPLCNDWNFPVLERINAADTNYKFNNIQILNDSGLQVVTVDRMAIRLLTPAGSDKVFLCPLWDKNNDGNLEYDCNSNYRSAKIKVYNVNNASVGYYINVTRYPYSVEISQS